MQRSIRFSLCVFLLALAAPAFAADYPVGCGATAAADLASAMTAAVNGPDPSNSVTLAAACTYSMTWDGTTKAADGSPTIFTTIGRPVVVNGNGATITLTGASLPARFFYIDAGGTLTLGNLSLKGGIARGADGANAPAAGNSSAPGGAYSGLGGAIYNAGILDADAVTFDSNQAIGGNGGCGTNGGTSGGGGAGIGGAVFSVSATLSIRNSTFVGNAATGGHSAASGSCTYTSGAAGGGGGGSGGMGAFDNLAGSTGTGTSGGYGGGGGGAMFLVTNSGGNGGFGGGAGGPNASPGEFGASAAAGYFSGGTGAGLGGALFIESVTGSAQVVASTFGGNLAHGGDANYFGSSDGATGAGGGVFVHSGTLSMIADTLSGNSASGGSVSNSLNPQNGGNAIGGGIFVHSGATLNLALTVVTQGVVIAGTSSNGGTGTASDPDISGSISSAGYNLVTTRGASSGYVSSDLADGTAANLGSLASNGGATQTFLPQPGSAAIDAAPASACNNLVTDQRGYPRPFGVGCDIGAVEISDIIFRNDFEAGTQQPAVQCSNVLGYADVLIDNFPGPTLGANWTQNTNGGTVTVNNGASLASSAAQFPFITANGSPIPAIGNFSVRWRATYTAISGLGTGTLVLSNGLPANNASDDYTLRSADAWQDNLNGFTVRARLDVKNYNTVFVEYPPQDVTHDVEYCWLGDNVEVWVDGARSLLTPSAGLTRPNALWFGNPVNVGSSGAEWSDFTLDHVYVRSVGP